MSIFDNAHPGSIIVTRNTDEVGNRNPGHWNHAAVLTINGWVVEAQPNLTGPDTPGGVIAVPVAEFERRYPEICVFTLEMCPSAQRSAAFEAATFIGNGYSKWGSIASRWWRRPNAGHNCVSLVTASVIRHLGYNPHWRRPDHIVADLYSQVGWKVAYAEWEHPGEWFTGATLDRADIYRTNTNASTTRD